MRTVTAPELADWLQDPSRPSPVILDVREHWEIEIASLPDSEHVPMGRLPSSLDRLQPERTTVCLCHHGARSLQVAMYLERQGFTDVINLTGGIHAWAVQVDPSIAVY